jgi:nitroreductase
LPTDLKTHNWHFVPVRDREQRKAIRAVAWDQAQVTDASELTEKAGEIVLDQDAGTPRRFEIALSDAQIARFCTRVCV